MMQLPVTTGEKLCIYKRFTDAISYYFGDPKNRRLWTVSNLNIDEVRVENPTMAYIITMVLQETNKKSMSTGIYKFDNDAWVFCTRNDYIASDPSFDKIIDKNEDQFSKLVSPRLARSEELSSTDIFAMRDYLVCSTNYHLIMRSPTELVVEMPTLEEKTNIARRLLKFAGVVV